ncbi:TRAP transporter permease [Elioraea sp.]|uniref:TRAP transporter permease n=1 Tax=Elioraea sp. TaxID=2185103 RepID=UPI0025BACCA6|nr:TRAP transporter permease [Elioraea sp.]
MSVGAIAATFSLFHLWTSYVGTLPTLQQAYVHLGFALVLIFLTKPLVKTEGRPGAAWLRWTVDGTLIAASAFVSAYAVVNFLELSQRGAGNPSELSIWLGVVAVLIVIEATRRMVGLALPILATVFLVYAFVGPYMPGPLGHRGYDLERVAATLYVTTSGLAGTPLQVSATYVAIFIIFAAFLDASGAGKFFIEWSYAGLGWLRGGPAKVAVVGSALMGTISGSAVANVVATGTFTIPVMKRAGLKPAFAGGVEAAASSGGQIMPPVMGAAAFIMVEILGAPYTTIMAAALLPAVLYFVAILAMVDFEVAKQGIKGLPRSALPSAWGIFKQGWHLLAPLALLIYLLVVIEYTPITSAVYGIAAIFAVSFLRGATRMNPQRLWTALQSGGTAMLEVAAACATAGIVIGILMLTGLATRLSTIMIGLAGGSLFLLMVITMVISLILGMGLPTSAVYVVLATLVVPAMVEMGVDPLGAHMFVFYFGVLANVTPPVAIAAYAGAGLAGSNPTETGVIAFKIALAGFLLPFVWVYNPALLLQGDVLDIVLVTFSALVGIVALASAVQGYLPGGRSRWYQRLLMGAGALALIKPGLVTDLLGFGLIGIALLSWYVGRRAAGVEATERST